MAQYNYDKCVYLFNIEALTSTVLHLLQIFKI